ncbi:MAG: histidine ammonia-lyase [bacterium]
MILLTGHELNIDDIIKVALEGENVGIDEQAKRAIQEGRQMVERYLESGHPAYGINTGFGALCDTSIAPDALRELQQNLVRSHASGVGEHFPPEVVRAAMILRANSLCRGHSGVRLVVVETLVSLLNSGIIPAVHSQGSLGASGDLAPLADLALVLLGEGSAWLNGELISGAEALKKASIEPLTLEAKEGLALLNGTAFMTAVGVLTWDEVHKILVAQDAAAALSLAAFMGNTAAYAPELVAARPHPGALAVAEHLRTLLAGCTLVDAGNHAKIQDPYSFRCVPQVHGTVFDALRHVKSTLEIEINSTTDNPLIINGKVISGGNFHGQPVGAILDYLAVTVASMAAMAERRVNQLLHPAYSGLSAFLVPNSGLNSGFMIAQYTAASLVNENRVLATPATVQSVPVSADQEDHISMATFAASKCRHLVTNASAVTAIEIMTAAQAIDLRLNKQEWDPANTLGPTLAPIYELIRQKVPFIERDSQLSGYIEHIAHLIAGGSIRERLQGCQVDLIL